jgi:N-acetylglucosaminyldiphosphoundecaprenol N-acetyl-beta-D-mannosaminyltransferase
MGLIIMNKHKNNRLESFNLLGVNVDNLPLNKFLEEIQCLVTSPYKSIISYVNIHALNLAYTIPWFRTFLNQSTIVFCDGFGIKIAAFLKWEYQINRYTPPDFINQICMTAVKNNQRLFFLGAQPGISEKAACDLIKQFPGLNIGTHHGYFEKFNHSEECNQVIKKINLFNTDILFVGFGMPLQEKWIKDNFDRLEAKVIFPVGALFDYVSGEIPRAPRWMTDYGFEWAGRLIIEPKRLWKRYIIGNPLFFWRVFLHDVLGLPLPN